MLVLCLLLFGHVFQSNFSAVNGALSCEKFKVTGVYGGGSLANHARYFIYKPVKLEVSVLYASCNEDKQTLSLKFRWILHRRHVTGRKMVWSSVAMHSLSRTSMSSSSTPRFTGSNLDLGLYMTTCVVTLVGSTRLYTSHASYFSVVEQGAPPTPSIACVSNCQEYIDPTADLVLKASHVCAHCIIGGNINYRILYVRPVPSSYFGQFNPLQNISTAYIKVRHTNDMDTDFFTLSLNMLEFNLRHKETHSLNFQAGVQGFPWSSSLIYQFSTSARPTGANCVIAPLIARRSDMVRRRFACSIAQDEDGPVIYKIYADELNGTETLLFDAGESNREYLAVLIHMIGTPTYERMFDVPTRIKIFDPYGAHQVVPIGGVVSWEGGCVHTKVTIRNALDRAYSLFQNVNINVRLQYLYCSPTSPAFYWRLYRSYGPFRVSVTLPDAHARDSTAFAIPVTPPLYLSPGTYIASLILRLDSLDDTLPPLYYGVYEGTFRKLPLTLADPPNLLITCESCGADGLVNSQRLLSLSTECENCDVGEELTYVWASQPGDVTNTVQNFDVSFDSIGSHTSSSILFDVGRFALPEPEEYSFTVQGTRQDGSVGVVNYFTFTTSGGPEAGTCIILPPTGFYFSTFYSLTCEGFTDEHGPITYAVYYDNSGLDMLVADEDMGPLPSFKLPRGELYNDFKLPVKVKASDRFGSPTAIIVEVIVVGPVLPTCEGSEAKTHILNFPVGDQLLVHQFIQYGTLPFQVSLTYPNCIPSTFTYEWSLYRRQSAVSDRRSDAPSIYNRLLLPESESTDQTTLVLGERYVGQFLTPDYYELRVLVTLDNTETQYFALGFAQFYYRAVTLNDAVSVFIRCLVNCDQPVDLAQRLHLEPGICENCEPGEELTYAWEFATGDPPGFHLAAYLLDDGTDGLSIDLSSFNSPNKEEHSIKFISRLNINSFFNKQY